MRIDEQKGYPTIRDSLFYKLLHLFDPAVDEAFLAKKRLKRRDLGAASRCLLICQSSRHSLRRIGCR